jgi:hypothetical protein
MRFVTATGILVVLVLLPDIALAWGPVTHVELARCLLQDYRDVFSLLASSVLSHPNAFLVGAIAPDAFLAKNLNRYANHTHNWDRAFEMLRSADSAPLQSFACGYLSHLAADVVAHNVFVPTKMLQKEGLRGRSHSYWEMKFEQHQPDAAWQATAELERTVPRQEFDAFVEAFQVPSVFSFRTNRDWTRRAFLLLRTQPARRFLSRFELRSSTPVSDEEVGSFMDLSMGSIIDVLRQKDESPCAGMDPRGDERIKTARSVSRAVSALRLGDRFTRSATGQPWSRLVSMLDNASEALSSVQTRRGLPAHKSAFLPKPRS